MKCESRITLEETPAFAAAATAIIDDRLLRLSETERASYWHSVHKAYNAPYNDPPKRNRNARLGTERSIAPPQTVLLAAAAALHMHAA